MKKLLTLILAGSTITAAFANSNTNVAVRIKDVTRMQGVENYTMIGYGVVVGLAGSGDSDNQLTQRTLANLLENFNIITTESRLSAQNAAAVMVTATIRKSANKGDLITATVSSIGDAASLLGGELLLTPLLGVDGETWAIAQGPLTTGGFSFGGGGGGGDTRTKNHPTVAMLTNGAKLMRDVGLGIADSNVLTILLAQPDYTTAVNLAEAINSRYFGSALTIDASTVRVRVPRNYREENRVAEFISNVEQVPFQPDQVARVVFNERTGTIVFGGNVKISQVAISHGSISVSIKTTEGASQPNPFAQGETVQLQNQELDMSESEAPLNIVGPATTIGELVVTLNQLGVTPRDIMIIFHALRQAGALHASLEAI